MARVTETIFGTRLDSAQALATKIQIFSDIIITLGTMGANYSLANAEFSTTNF